MSVYRMVQQPQDCWTIPPTHCDLGVI